MKEVVDVGLPTPSQPFSWAVKASGTLLFTAHGPVRADGSVHTGAVEDQARLTFTNLRNAVQAAGGYMDDVAQMLIYILDVADMPVIDRVYREFFASPYPSRSSAVVAALVVPHMKIEIVAYVAVGSTRGE